ncbi:hypothetical protein Y032_0537g3119 [Ancylostoma ceylanicum]|uniref:Uncharacterized protein n=1 Tax=Ancylostoma ceylanicum TaxID=53326 RepID=A0A016WSM2_9BILA|nr:hypothetical protein Y032_0537g3119 [Ancylostoma ceylanicum]
MGLATLPHDGVGPHPCQHRQTGPTTLPLMMLLCVFIWHCFHVQTVSSAFWSLLNTRRKWCFSSNWGYPS